MNERRRPIRALIALAVVLIASPATTTAAQDQAPSRRFSARTVNPADLPGPLDNVIFRPTVLIRNGVSRGSGTIIASAPGRSLVLTAAHVIGGEGDPAIELHRYNLGIEGRKLGGTWPKVVPARVVAADHEADVAVLLVEGLAKMPFVARLDPGLDEPPPSGSPVTSVGIDQASDLNCWDSRIRGTALLSRNQADESGAEPFLGLPADRAGDGGDPDEGGGEPRRPPRLFLITEHAPIPGRSGGGLFSDDGRLLGLCVGRIEVKSTRGDSAAIGLFASGRSIRNVLEQLDRAGAAPN